MQEIQHQMARVRSTARVTRDGEETKAVETTLISEVMRRSGLVVTEGAPDEDAPATEAEQVDIEEGDIGEEEIDYNTAMPSKPSHLDFGKSTVSEADMAMMTKLGYFKEADKGLIRFGGEETIPKPENDEVVVFKSFFKAGLRFPLHGMIGDVLENFEIYLHQLTPTPLLGSAFTSRPPKVKGWSHSPKPSVEYMNFTIRRRLGKTDCMRTLAATTLLIAKT
jgi:hypothetical protein